MYADWAFLPRGDFPERANILLGADIEPASSFLKFLLDTIALLSMLFAVLVLTILIAIPNALARRALLEGIALLSARRAQLGCRGGPIFRGGFAGVDIIVHPFLADSPSDMDPSC